MKEVFLTCIAAADVNPSSDGEEVHKSCLTNEDERKVCYNSIGLHYYADSLDCLIYFLSLSHP